MNKIYTIARINGGAIAWTDEQVAYIIDKYLNENYTLKQLGREFGCNYGTIRHVLNQHGITSRGNKQGYPRDEFYFSEIDTPTKAYWLGFLYADGYVHPKTTEISINITDKEHVEKFQKAIKAVNHKITTTIDDRWKNAKPLYQFSIKDKQLHQDLIKWGCIPQKSLKLDKFPNIPYDYIPHFLRGYFDGNGSLHYSKGTNNFRVSFVGTKAFLQNIKEYFNLNVSIAKKVNSNIYQLQIAGRKQVVRILNILYKDSIEENRLDRKYQSYLDCLKWAGASSLNS